MENGRSGGDRESAGEEVRMQDREGGGGGEDGGAETLRGGEGGGVRVGGKDGGAETLGRDSCAHPPVQRIEPQNQEGMALLYEGFWQT